MPDTTPQRLHAIWTHQRMGEWVIASKKRRPKVFDLRANAPIIVDRTQGASGRELMRASFACTGVSVPSKTRDAVEKGEGIAASAKRDVASCRLRFREVS